MLTSEVLLKMWLPSSSRPSLQRIAATLHKELQANESLMMELREAYDELKKHSSLSRSPVNAVAGRSKSRDYVGASLNTNSSTHSAPMISQRSPRYMESALTRNPVATVLDSLFSRIDANSDGIIDRQEFNRFVQPGRKIWS